MANTTPGYKTIDKEEFDNLARQPELWSESPVIETIETRYGDPYDPGREVRGTLKDGRKIRSVV